jgi:general secretion pathway protein J
LSTSVHDREPLSARGFTLAEILIAIAIFALLVSIIMGSFNGVFSRTEALGVQRVNNAMARSCLMRMATDLSDVYVEKPPFFKPPESLEEPPIYRFAATRATDAGESKAILQFASRAHVDFSGQNQQGIAVIRYFLEPARKGDVSTFRLRRSDVLVDGDELPETDSDPILCENILTFQVECIGADGEASEEWDSSSQDQNYATPRAVQIRLELYAPEGAAVYQTIVPLPLWRAASGKV